MYCQSHQGITNQMENRTVSNRNIYFLIMVATIILASIMTITAVKVYQQEIRGTFTTGSVEIDVKQYELVNGELIESKPRNISPGEQLSYIPEIENLRADGYIRVKVDLDNFENNTVPLTTDNIFMLSDGWIKRGDYFYYTKAVTHGEKQALFQGISIPREWRGGDNGFTVNLTADVVQSANFTPDWESESPWGFINIEPAKEDLVVDYGVAKPVDIKEHVITWNKKEGFETDMGGLFDNADYFMPGDVYTDSVKLRNKSNNEIRLYLKMNSKELDILSGMKLKLSINGKELYNGAGLGSSDWIDLVNLKSGEEAVLDYEVEFPIEAANDQSEVISSAALSWEFKAAEIATEDSSVNAAGAKTGDELNLAADILVIALCAIFLSVLVRERKKLLEKKNL